MDADGVVLVEVRVSCDTHDGEQDDDRHDGRHDDTWHADEAAAGPVR
jgi:hypothetical protein